MGNEKTTTLQELKENLEHLKDEEFILTVPLSEESEESEDGEV